MEKIEYSCLRCASKFVLEITPMEEIQERNLKAVPPKCKVCQSEDVRPTSEIEG